MNDPGVLSDLDDAHSEWQRRVDATLVDVSNQLLGDNRNEFVVQQPGPATPHRTAVDWPGFPLRPAECTTRLQALALLDLIPPTGGMGIRPLQEEYVEWRVVHGEHGIRRIELTTEMGDYWRLLAAHQPRRTLDLISEFARHPVDPAAVYGDCDPFAASPGECEHSFSEVMLSPTDPSPYNDGRLAITCMAQRSNTLTALLALMLAATTPRVVVDVDSGQLRCPTCDEIIPLLGDIAQAGRASDPVLVERFARLAYEGRLVALDDPVGVYMQSVEHTRLRLPDGDPIPAEWFTFTRGVGPSDTLGGRARWQRLTLEPPTTSGLGVSDLVDSATEQPIRFGGQVAELVQVAVLLRVSGPDINPPGPLEPTQVAHVATEEARGCAGIRDALRLHLLEEQ